MPFPDELVPVVLVDDDGRWDSEYTEILQRLRALELSDIGAIEHVGSTAVPGLVAKDVIDIQIRVPELNAEVVIARFSAAGYRHRREEWNNAEATRAGPFPKLAFAPPVGARRSNVHVRSDDSPGARDTLLFRDYLRAEDDRRRSWDRFKRSIVDRNPELGLAADGQAKLPAWAQLMSDADDWARNHEWQREPMLPWADL